MTNEEESKLRLKQAKSMWETAVKQREEVRSITKAAVEMTSL